MVPLLVTFGVEYEVLVDLCVKKDCQSEDEAVDGDDRKNGNEFEFGSPRVIDGGPEKKGQWREREELEDVEGVAEFDGEDLNAREEAEGEKEAGD